MRRITVKMLFASAVTGIIATTQNFKENNFMQKTYCNPLSIKNIKTGRKLDGKGAGKKTPEELMNWKKDYRSISDPSVIYYDGKWIMYPSYELAYVSEDFIHWEYVDIGVHDIGYSPAIVHFRNKWYLLGYNDSRMFSADSPLGPFSQCGELTDTEGNVTAVVDECFLADGDRLYMYFHTGVPAKDIDVQYFTATGACEMDPERPWVMKTKPVIINKFDPDRKWQRFGEYNQNERMGWVEGQWAFKIGSRYYLMYSGCGTELSAYANGIVYSDEGPLSGFVCQKRHDPLTLKRTGLITGAGHGSIAEGPNGTHWVFYTNRFGYNFIYERRVSMDPIGIDENGELFCPATTETPQYAPGVLEHPENGNDCGLYPLTFMTYPTATSHADGRDPIYASDESVITWWQPEKDDPEKTITFNLDADTAYEIFSTRVIWRDIGMESCKGVPSGPFGYIIEYNDKNGWKTLLDASDNKDDLCIDYRECHAPEAYSLRLKITSSPEGITPGLVSFTAFGKCVHRPVKN